MKEIKSDVEALCREWNTNWDTCQGDYRLFTICQARSAIRCLKKRGWQKIRRDRYESMNQMKERGKWIRAEWFENLEWKEPYTIVGAGYEGEDHFTILEQLWSEWQGLT